MKKTLFLPLLLCSFALASCENPPAHKEEVEQLKALLSQQDLSPATAKMFVSNFYQDYDVFSSTHGEEGEAETQFHSYHGGGVVGCFYEVDEAAYREVEGLESHDFFDYLARGTGSYGMLQTASLVSYHRDEEEEKEDEPLQSMNYLQRLESYFGEDDVQVYNSLSYAEELGTRYDHSQSFNGIIRKDALFDAITARAFSDIFARTNLYDGQRWCETLDRIYFALLGEMNEKSDQELSDFIEANAIRFEEQEEQILVHFAAGEESLRAILEENEIIPGDFTGTLSYEKGSGSFSAFDYRIAYVNVEAGENGDTRASSMEFKATGYSWNRRYDSSLYIEPNPTVYDDAEAFLEDVVREVIPPTF